MENKLNKYWELLGKIVVEGKDQVNKKGGIRYLINETLSMDIDDLDKIFAEHRVAKKLLRLELDLYMAGETRVSEYKKQGIHWWDYCAPRLINSYPTYFVKLQELINKINREKRSSKNYMFFIGDTDSPTNQLPCLSLMQFQISDGELYITVYQRSADSSLGLPSDIWQTVLIANMIDVPLANITYQIGNAHIYSNNIEKTHEMLVSGVQPSFDLNV